MKISHLCYNLEQRYMGNLFEARVRLIDLTGRYDLIKDTDSYEDAGANFFINAGIKMLNRITGFGARMWEREVTAIGSLYVKDLNVLKDVFLVSSDGSKTLLDRGLIPTQAVVEGIPSMYQLKGYIPTKGFRVQLYPSPTEAMPADLILYGRFEYTLSMDTDSNIWTEQYMETLISAAMFSIERYYRNTEAANDHLEAINIDIQGIDFDEADSHSGTLDQMRDSV